MPQTADRAIETSTTVGTGNLTLSGTPVAGFQTLFAALSSQLNMHVPYVVEGVDANGVPTGEWETGFGYLSASTTFVRDIVRESSNAGALVNFSAGTKRIGITLIADGYPDYGRQLAVIRAL